MTSTAQAPTVQPRAVSATRLCREQACSVPVWSLMSTCRSKPLVSANGWSLPGHDGLLQPWSSWLTWYLHLVLRWDRKLVFGRYARRKCNIL